jgi:hypothetical protein
VSVDDLTPAQVAAARADLAGRITLPSMFKFEEVIAKFRPAPEGGYGVWRLDPATGGWLRDDMLVRLYMYEQEVSLLFPPDFIDLVETARAHAGVGEGDTKRQYEELAAHLDECYRVFCETRRTPRPMVDHLWRLQLATYRAFESDLRRHHDVAAEPELADRAERERDW